MITVKLAPERQSFVQQRIEAGHFASADELVDEAIRLMEENEDLLSMTRESVRAKIEAGVKSLQRGEGVDGEEFFAKMELEFDALERNGHP